MGLLQPGAVVSPHPLPRHDRLRHPPQLQAHGEHCPPFHGNGCGHTANDSLQDGFGVNTYRFVNDEGESKLVKFHWRTTLGKASLVWEEAQIAAGANADFHREDLWNAIEEGNYPEWELHVQVINEDQALDFGIDVLDPTKIIPEELVPLKKIGKMRLDKNPSNYFAETEQIMVSDGRASHV